MVFSSFTRGHLPYPFGLTMHAIGTFQEKSFIIVAYCETYSRERDRTKKTKNERKKNFI